MQSLGCEFADSGLKNHPHPSQAAWLWAFLPPVTQNQETRLLREKILWAVGRKADVC